MPTIGTGTGWTTGAAPAYWSLGVWCLGVRAARNQRRRADNTSGYIGVNRHEGKWVAVSGSTGSASGAGHFDDAEEAAHARDAAALEAYGEFAVLNFP